MKTVQWYPGHMAKAMRMLEENLSLVDAAVFVLDARAPASSYNPRLEALTRDKPVLFALNKSDLADSGAAEAMEIIRARKKACILTSAAKDPARLILSEMQLLTKEKEGRLKEKGSSRALRFLVAGIPNTGKSSLINLLSGGKKAKTGDKAGVTRSKQWVKCASFELLDSPGLMPPSLENQTFAKRLAAVGSINDDILAIDEIALFILEELSLKYPERLKERYGIEEGEPLALLEGVCKRRGFMLRGGEYDYERGEKAIIDDLRKGKLGRVTLDSSEDVRAVFGE